MAYAYVDYSAPCPDPTNPYRQPDPVLVASIVDGYGIHAAMERWSSLTRNAVEHIAQKGRKISRQQRAVA